jgi:hypothetical protein
LKVDATRVKAAALSIDTRRRSLLSLTTGQRTSWNFFWPTSLAALCSGVVH